MKYILQIFLSLIVTSSSSLISESMVNYINSQQDSWVATHHERFINATSEDLSAFCGSILSKHALFDPLPLHSEHSTTSTFMHYKLGEVDTLPVDYDTLLVSDSCKSIIGHVRDQSACGSCWAFASTSTFNDRRCLVYNDQTLYSPEDTLSCCSGLKCGLSQGCNGGQPTSAWKWFVSTGVTTGGDFKDMDTGNTCNPYPFASCTHHPVDDSVPTCPVDEYQTPKCTRTCLDTKYPTNYADDKVFAKTAYTVKGVSAIMTEIVKNGPVTAAFTVYEDFMTYKNGVYHHVTGKELGGHAVEIVGYGIDPITKEEYWKVKNSWNTDWGESGFFRIRRGTNECGIEDNISAGLV